MRKDFFTYLYQLMKENQNIWALTGDLGFGGYDRIQDEFPQRFLNTGAAEQALVDIAAGLAIEGKTAVVYSITPFLLYRPFESLRTYINHEKIPIILIGSGRDDDYKHDGYSHSAFDDRSFMMKFENIYSYWPKDSVEMEDLLDEAIQKKRPTYINLLR